MKRRFVFPDAPTAARLAIAAAALTAISACTRSEAQQPTEAPPVPVSVATVLDREVTAWDEFTGRLEAVDTVSIRPRVSGYIGSVHFDEGSAIRKGQLLFQIDPRPFEAEADRLRAERTRATAVVRRADSEFSRAGRLQAENAIANEEFERRSASRDEARAQLAAVEAALRAAELNLEFTRVASPIAGRVGRAVVTEGNLVASGPGEATLLTTVVSMNPIYAYFDADEQIFLRYQGNGHARTAPGARADARCRWPWPRTRASRARDISTFWTTSSIRRPARLEAAPSLRTPRRAHAGSLRPPPPIQRRPSARRVDSGPRRRDRPRQEVRLRRG